MWQDRHYASLREEIEALLESLAESNLYCLIEESLAQEKQYSDTESVTSQMWPLLPLIVCEAISGHYQRALPAASALQLLKTTAEIFDDIEDADSSKSLSSRYGNAIAVNVATTLLILSEKAITRLKAKGVEDYIVIRVMDVVSSYYTVACAGQHLDLVAGPGTNISEDDYINITGMKSATTIECSCYIGALLATENQRVIDKFAAFGRNLGISSQIANDIQGITRGNDITKRKVTLPVIYALTQTSGEICNHFKIAFCDPTEPVFDTAQIRDLLFSTGAVQYALIKMECYRQSAFDCLIELEKSGVNVERLKSFLG
jgi:geranylgeranyl pyrophosphate synthase